MYSLVHPVSFDMDRLGADNKSCEITIEFAHSTEWQSKHGFFFFFAVDSQTPMNQDNQIIYTYIKFVIAYNR